uniref:ER membrane protein complex subunit 6 n=1 Tax=Oxyrrhis marina TaxID=2969 RepID=A0A7S3UMX8_OXYMA
MAPKFAKRPVEVTKRLGKGSMLSLDGAELLLPSNLQHNNKQLTLVRSWSAIVAGVVSGMMGVEGLSGVLAFVLANFLMSFLVFFFALGGDPKKYFYKPRDLFMGQFMSGLQSFVLSWTIAYDYLYCF